jgi:putative peptidoglycan lipid II flippase
VVWKNKVPSHKQLNGRATAVITVAVMISRILGLIREVLFNALFGSAEMGVFLVAFRAPNLLRDLFAEGALSISFITVFSKKLEMEGENSAWMLASKMMTLLCCLMSVVSILGIFYAKKVIAMLAPGFTYADSQAVILLTQVMYPFILLVSLSALAMGVLNSKNMFRVPALASSFFNIGSIVGGVLCGWFIDPLFGKKALLGLAIGTLIGGLLQLAVQIPSLRRAGFYFKFNFSWNDPDVRKVLLLTLPAVIAASALQMNILINSSFASYMGKETVTWLNSAFRLMQFPIGIFGVAIATTTLPVISRIAATKDHSEFGPTLAYAMRLAIFFTMPAAVGLWFFAEPIIKLVYEHGKFTSADSMQTAFALQFYALGLMSYACIKVIAPGFYAINKKWTPMAVSFLTIAINIILNYFFIYFFNMGYRGLALSATLSATVNVISLYWLMGRAHDLQTRYFLDNFMRCMVASLALGMACHLSLTVCPYYIYGASFGVRCMAVFSAIIFSAMAYFSVCLILRIDIARRLIFRSKNVYFLRILC